ncbi:MAG: ribonuclease HII [Clostridia bacterium]|nr:ribonuclease HII [Clostridia bacterium]
MKHLKSIEEPCTFEQRPNVAGVDEAGRGPLAGPVFAAAVILPPDYQLNGLRDSKDMSAAARRRLNDVIIKEALAYGIGYANVAEIEELNILHASMLAKRRAVLNLPFMPETLIIDGNRHIPDMPIPQITVVKGDSICKNIAAAGILAKVARDELMGQIHDRFPLYGFDRHKGYGTPEHIIALREHGPCEEHRGKFIEKVVAGG